MFFDIDVLYYEMKDFDKNEEQKTLRWIFFNNDIINKSLVDDIRYSDNDLKFSVKKGSEIKTALTQYLKQTQEQAKTILERLLDLTQIIPSQPDTLISADDYNFNAKYSFKNFEDESVSEEIKERMRKFNNCVYKLKGIVEDVKFINELINNINEGKNYRLPINIITQLEL